MASGWVPVPALLLKALGDGTFIFRATPGRVRRAETQDEPGWKRKEKALGPSLVPPVVGIRGCEQNHLWDICEGSRALEMPRETEKVIHSCLHSPEPSPGLLGSYGPQGGRETHPERGRPQTQAGWGSVGSDGLSVVLRVKIGVKTS